MHWVRSLSRSRGNQPAGDFLSHLPSSISAITFRQACVTFPAEEYNPSTSTKLYCFVTEVHTCEQLVQDCYAALSRWKLNPQPIDRESNALPLCPLFAQSMLNYSPCFIFLVIFVSSVILCTLFIPFFVVFI